MTASDVPYPAEAWEWKGVYQGRGWLLFRGREGGGEGYNSPMQKRRRGETVRDAQPAAAKEQSSSTAGTSSAAAQRDDQPGMTPCNDGSNASSEIAVPMSGAPPAPSLDRYPTGTVRALLPTVLVTPPTRAVLEARLRISESAADGAPPEPRFFSVSEFSVLEAVCAHLLDLSPADTPAPREIASLVDERLAEGRTNGWRYDMLPADGPAYRLGLAWLGDAARTLFGAASFIAAEPEQQDRVLRALRGGPDETIRDLSPLPGGDRFFEEMLAELAECYYSHPLAQEEIGYAGMADGRGWKRISLNEREEWEPKPNAPYLLPAFANENRAPVAPVREEAEVILLPGVLPPPPQQRSAAAFPAFSPAPGSGRSRGTAPVILPPVDVVVIGTGAGGAPVLARLAQAGFTVVALEAGRFWEPVRDFATDERAQKKLFWNDERLSAGSDPIPFGANNSGIGVGGTTLHYTAYTPRPHADDFRLHTDFGVGADWPLTYAELEPYLTEVEQFLGVSGPIPYPWADGIRSGGYPLPPLPLNGAAELMARGCKALKIRTSPAPNAALSGPHYVEGIGWRRACTNRGFCQAGCSVGAKASMDVTYIPLALAHGAEIRSECFVTRLERDRATDRVSGVVYIQADGREVRQGCRAVFLCAGAIETPRLLLLNEIESASGQVGRNLMAHVGLQVWGQFDEDVRPYKGIPGGLISEDTHRPADADFAGGYLLQSLGVLPVTYVTQLARGERVFGAALREHMLGYNRVAGINVCGEGLPNDGSFLELSEEKDARGLPKPRVHFAIGENERRLEAHAERLMRRIWEAAGARRHVWAYRRHAHTLGTCRMGADPAAAVVSPEGQFYGVPNLFVSDNSVFPSSLSVNPALTQMALSLRTADRFIAAARRGEI